MPILNGPRSQFVPRNVEAAFEARVGGAQELLVAQPLDNYLRNQKAIRAQNVGPPYSFDRPDIFLHRFDRDLGGGSAHIIHREPGRMRMRHSRDREEIIVGRIHRDEPDVARVRIHGLAESLHLGYQRCRASRARDILFSV